MTGDVGALGTVVERALSEHRQPGEILHIFDEAWMNCGCGKKFDLTIVDGAIRRDEMTSLYEAHVAAEVARALGAETRVEWGVRYGDGDVDIEAVDATTGAEFCERVIGSHRLAIAAGRYEADDYEPMTTVSRTVTTFRHESEWAEVRAPGATETPLGPNRARTSTDSTGTLLGREQALSGEVSEQGDGRDAGE